MTDAPASTRPLDGVTVLDLSRMYPGAYCTQLLADLGADVLKVESPGGGDGMRFMTPEPFKAAHVALNRGKRSMTLNLKSPQSGEILRRLVRGADVLVESARPGMMDKLGLGFDDLRRENHRLVWCSLSGFGPDGPNAQAPGHDLTYLGYAGVLDSLTVGDEPAVPAAPITLPVAGLMGAFGIVAALQGRTRTGEGTLVDVNMVDSAMWMLGEQLAQAANDASAPWGSLACRANYRCADGRWVTCTASEPRAWAMVVEALEVPELADYTMGTDEEATQARLRDVFATQPQARWLESPGMAGGIGPVHTAGDLVADPQLTHRQGMVHVDGDGPLVLANPLRLDRATGPAGSAALGPAPELGQDTDAVLADLGFTAEGIAALRAEQAV